MRCSRELKMKRWTIKLNICNQTIEPVISSSLLYTIKELREIVWNLFTSQIANRNPVSVSAETACRWCSPMHNSNDTCKPLDRCTAFMLDELLHMIQIDWRLSIKFWMVWSKDGNQNCLSTYQHRWFFVFVTLNSSYFLVNAGCGCPTSCLEVRRNDRKFDLIRGVCFSFSKNNSFLRFL
jgi:hypothetical protein